MSGGVIGTHRSKRACSPVAEASVVVEVGVGGQEVDCPCEVAYCRCEVPTPIVADAPVVEGIRVTRIDLQCPAVVSDGGGEVTQLIVGEAAATKGMKGWMQR